MVKGVRYAMANILSAARVNERAGRTSTAQEGEQER
jgi:hypothetical protein